MKTDPNGPITSDNPQLSRPKETPVASPNDGRQVERLQSIAPARTAPSLADYINAAASANTRRAYRDDLADFERYGGSVPCSPEALAEYIAFRAASSSAYTVARRVVGICRAHRSLGFSDPSKNDLVRTVLRGVKRSCDRPQRQARPLLPEHFFAILPHLAGPSGMRDRAILLVGFAAALRRSEVIGLDVADLEFVDEGMIVFLRRSKTDQEQRGRRIAVPYARSIACPVNAVKAWLMHAEVVAGPIFRPISRSGKVLGTRLASASVNSIVKHWVNAVGMDPNQFSGHSLRCGLVTSAARAGVPMHKIMEQTGHQSVQMMNRYIRDARLFDENAAGAVL